jgi:hypothetical protein
MTTLNENKHDLHRFIEEGYAPVNPLNKPLTKPRWAEFVESLNHARQLTALLAEKISAWKASILGMTNDPRRFRERIIFYHGEDNYLLKMMGDLSFLDKTVLANFLPLAPSDPFLLYPFFQKPRKECQLLVDSL